MRVLATIVPVAALALVPWVGAQEMPAPGPGGLTIEQEVRPPLDTIDVHQTPTGITVHGTVPSRDEQRRVESSLEDLDPAPRVKNLLQVVPPERAGGVGAEDARRAIAVEMRLKEDQELADSAITVASVHDGTVLLRGTARSEFDHHEAMQVAGTVEGIRAVFSDVVVEAPEAFAETRSPAGGFR
ncbi:MAG: BON domain-containing protein [Candidatus Binatia bacterium]